LNPTNPLAHRRVVQSAKHYADLSQGQIRPSALALAYMDEHLQRRHLFS